MDPSEYYAGGNPSDQENNQRRQLQICGPRPSPLSVHKDSHKIKKPPKHPSPPYAAREPVAIYAVSPKVVHATASEFMNVVQRLTGISPGVFLKSGGGDVSPAARLAATENASPRGGKEPTARDETVEITTAMEEAAEFGSYALGILSPTPAMLPTASAGIFSPMSHQGGMIHTVKDLRSHLESNALPCAHLDKPEPEAYENTNSFVGVNSTDSVSFPPGSSKNLQDAELSIGFPGSQSMFLDRAYPDDASVRRTCATSSASKDYDVVITYGRGDVSNDAFISHLRAALYRRGISVNSEFDDGDAVLECRVYILLLTSTYVPSNLLSILEHQQKENRVVYPIFYRLSPYDLITNSKNYERFFLQDEPKRWQDALKEISQMPGYTLTDKSESELIDETVRDTLKVLCSGDKVNMIGMDMQVKEILSLLCIESLDVRSIGIWGTVGIGKTVIAEEIFRRISVQYETCVFLKDLHKKVEVKGHDAVREDFLSKVLEVEPHVIRVSDIRTSFLRSRLQRKRVLVILDDVNDYRDVETFLGKVNYFGPGSRIIMTSRNKRVFVQCKIDHVYEVKPLDIPNSLLLRELNVLVIKM